MRVSHFESGIAIERDRTADLTITNRLLYQLSYDGISTKKDNASARLKPIEFFQQVVILALLREET